MINENLLHTIENFPIRPTFNKVLITLNKVESDDDLQLSENFLSDTQFIVAKGNFVNEVEVGDKVIIDVEKLSKPVRRDVGNVYEEVNEVKIDQIYVDDVPYAFIDDRIIKAIDKR